MSFALGILGWLFATLLSLCFIEYAIHRWIMHARLFGRVWGIFERHAFLHHGRYFPGRHFTGLDIPDPASRHISIDFAVGDHILVAIPFAATLWFVWPPGSVVFLATIVAHALLWTRLHREMHFPHRPGLWFTASPLFRYLRDFHAAHHRQPTKNFGAVLPPLADWLFGTLAREEKS